MKLFIAIILSVLSFNVFASTWCEDELRTIYINTLNGEIEYDVYTKGGTGGRTIVGSSGSNNQILDLLIKSMTAHKNEGLAFRSKISSSDCATLSTKVHKTVLYKKYR